MPSIQIIGDPERMNEPSGVEQFFHGLRSHLKEREEQSTIGNIISNAQKNSQDAKALSNSIFELEKSPISPSKRLAAQKVIKDQQDALLERDKLVNTQAKAAMEAADKAKKEKTELDKEEGKKNALTAENKEVLRAGGFPEEEVERLAPITSAAGARALVKSQQPGRGPKEKFEDVLATKAAGEVGDLEKEIAKSTDLLSNVDTIEKIANENLKGIIGYGKALYGSESAKQVETLGATNLGSVIKLFNPAGTLPTAKLNWIKNTFAVSPWDNLSSMKGKLNTQRIILNQASARAKERLSLLKQYYGNIPPDVEKNFDQETSDLIDTLQEQLDPESLNGKKKSRPGMVQIPDPQGTLRWVPKELAEQLKGQK